MATTEGASAFERLMRESRRQDLPAVTWEAAGDLARLSVEAMAAQRGDARSMSSQGSVRLSGAGVAGHSADLDAVGQVATLWQRSITAVGASLEGAKAAMGRLPEGVKFRTQLTLNAAPGPGSIVLDLTPKVDPFLEVAPRGEARMFDAPRPLADRASETLIQLLAEASQVGPEAEDLAVRIRHLGPRVATAIKALAEALDREHFDVDVAWIEPNQPTRRASLSAGTSGWLHEFVAGNALDGVERELVGTVRTVSDIAKWSIETSEGRRQVDASSLDPETVRGTHVGQRMRLLVFVRITQRPDGTSSETYDALQVLGTDD